jgi:hypothetical protein
VGTTNVQIVLRAGILALELLDCQLAAESIRFTESVKTQLRNILAPSRPTRDLAASGVSFLTGCVDELAEGPARCACPATVKTLKNQSFRRSDPDAGRLDPGAEITRIGRFISDIYDLDLDLKADEFLISPRLARAQLPGPSPRTGVLVIEQADELQLGVYLDESDRDDPSALVEEASHLVCLSWHAAHDLQVSALILELQSEIDRFLYFCHTSGHLSFDCFEFVDWADWIDDETRCRYELARRRAHGYCRALARRYAERGDTPGLARELRRFYRSSPETKLAC